MIRSLLAVAALASAAAGAHVASYSSASFAYAHGTASAHGRMFIGLADAHENPFPTNQITIFADPNDLSRFQKIGVSRRGDIQTMVYDPVTDKVYFDLSSSGGLYLYALDPVTYAIREVIATTTVDTGRRPAIATDGRYIYGITHGPLPSIVFKVRIVDGALWTSKRGHIPDGHSAAVGVFGSTTELYFGGGMSGQFEKDDAATLRIVGQTGFAPCELTDDMPFWKAGPAYGYVYLGCENQPYGYRVRTSDMRTDRFSLPGDSFGLFIFGDDLYNGAFDGTIDEFPGKDIHDLHRYRIVDAGGRFGASGLPAHVNEILQPVQGGDLYVTAWWGVKGLFRISTSTKG